MVRGRYSGVSVQSVDANNVGVQMPTSFGLVPKARAAVVLV